MRNFQGNLMVDKNLSLWLGLAPAELGRVASFPTALEELVERREEHQSSHRDQWGCWEHSFSDNYMRGKLWVPEVDQWLVQQRQQLRASGVPLVELWPDGKPFSVALSHDVDRYSVAYTLRQRLRTTSKISRATDLKRQPKANKLTFVAAGCLGPFQKKIRIPSTENTVDAIVEIEERYGARSTFFVTTYPVEPISVFDCVYRLDDPCLFNAKTMQVKEMLRELASRGFDIGLHGSYFSGEIPGILGKQRELLEAEVGCEVLSTRQHYLRWVANKTPELQREAGLRIDSTLGFNRNVGFRCGLSLPFFTQGMLEVPLVAQDCAFYGNSGLELDLERAKALMSQLIDSVASVGGCLTLSFHTDLFSEKRCRDLYAWTLEECAARGAWMGSMRQIADWWEQREARLAH